MKKSDKKEWVVIGGGIAGITAAEILTRNGHEVTLIEKENELASDTSAVFHEWMHFGSLYTLFPGLNKTLRFVLGGLDDLLEYYSDFERMNLIKSERGIKIEKDGWFSDQKILFRFRLKKRRLVLPWIIGVARSISIINKIKQHDWLRRRAGETKIKFSEYLYKLPKTFFEVITDKNDFHEVETADHLMNSRQIIEDLLSVAEKNGLEIENNTELRKIEETNDGYLLSVKKNGALEKMACANLVLANSKNITEFVNADFSNTYAPIVVAKNIQEEKRSFVNLDYFPSTCINSIYKGDGVAMLGGISFKTREECQPYIEYIVNENKKINPQLEPIDSYIGVKTEFIFKGEDRSYIYNIINHENSGVWTLVPGKFSLAFSMAVEFYRKVSMRNPHKRDKISENKKQIPKNSNVRISPHKYQNIINKKG
tara:strand:- start:2033 stop:3310 length:1278 start_codon:yes stop_codon:yes gene_type:complete